VAAVSRIGSWIGCALVALAAGCASAGGEVTAESQSADVEVQAAMLRWLIDNNDSPLRSSANAYCVGTGSGLIVGEPSPALIRALRGTLPRVQPISGCRWEYDEVVGSRIVDELSEAPALALFVELPQWSGPDEARVWAEYLERPGLGQGYDCVLNRGPSGWEVTDCSRGFPR
jgi:hypothetical protein